MTPRWKKANLALYVFSLLCIAEIMRAAWPHASRIIPGFEAKVYKDFWILMAIIWVPTIPFLLLYPIENFWLRRIPAAQTGWRRCLSIIFFALRLVGAFLLACGAILMHANWGPK